MTVTPDNEPGAASDHLPVMPHAVLSAWLGPRSGRYVDGTFGRGGHSGLLLSQLEPDASLLAIDRDPQAVAVARQMAPSAPQLQVRQSDFAQLPAVLEELGWYGSVDGLLLDLGVSSPQLDEAGRGFSFLRDGPLDMRMNPGAGESAAQWLAVAGAEEIAGVLWRFGEERHSRRIARAIVAQREQAPIERTGQLARLIEDVLPRREANKHPATRSFQAIRIFINDELGQLQTLLERSIDLLAPGGRLVIISFHSLEDRLVKRFMRNAARGERIPASVPVTADQQRGSVRLLGRAQRADDSEISRNPRARSAVLRVAEKLQ